MVNFVVNLANLAMKFKPNFEANFDLKAGNFGRENANFATNFSANLVANLAMKFKPNFALNFVANLSTSGENLRQNENAVNLQPKCHKFTA